MRRPYSMQQNLIRCCYRNNPRAAAVRKARHKEGICMATILTGILPGGLWDLPCDGKDKSP